MTTATAESMQSKIEKLLAKAERTDNLHEAEAFSRKAEALMVQWGISEAMLQAGMTQAEREKIVEHHMSFNGSYAQAMQHFGSCVAKALGLRTLVSGQGNHRRLHIIGFSSDVSRAELLITSLQLQAYTALKGFWRDYSDKDWMTENEKFKVRRTFLLAFGQEVQRRLSDERRKAEAEEAKTQAGSGMSVALVLASRDSEIDDWMGQHHPNLRNSRGSMQMGMGGYTAGRDAGRSANLGSRTSVQNNSTRALR